MSVVFGIIHLYGVFIDILPTYLPLELVILPCFHFEVTIIFPFQFLTEFFLSIAHILESIES